MPEIKHVLFAQQASVIDQHREVVRLLQLAERIGATFDFASSPADVEPRSHHDVLIAPTLPWLPQLLERTPDLKWIHFLSSGVEKIWDMDVDWASFTLSSSKGVHAVPISEYVVGAMLHFAKRFDQYVAQAQEARWHRDWLSELTGAEVLVVGAGSIGRTVADRCRYLGMRPRLMARTPRTDPAHGPLLGFGELSTAVKTCDYLVVAVPLTPETTGLIDEAVLARMKPSAVLIDVSRGGVVPDHSLLRALEAGELRGAASDVFDEEPLPADSPLWRRSNLLITPHVAGTTPHYMEQALNVFLDNANKFTNGDPLATPVDLDRRY